MSHYSPETKIGYLGGGQLARMLAESAHRAGLQPHVLCSNALEPAGQVTSHTHLGSLDALGDVTAFLKSVDVATFESEFLDSAVLIEAQKATETPIYPAPSLMVLLQDRKSQKQLFDENRLSSSPWAAVDTIEAIDAFIQRHKLPVVFKKRFFGYDGCGTFIIKSKVQLADFVKQQFKKELFIVEKFIPFQKEMAVILARSLDGSFTHLPFVESFQKDARCDWVKGPIKPKDNKKMLTSLKSFLKKLDYVGVMGVEFFVTNQGTIINEIAPRVHNTGHYSQCTPGLSQFDLHNMCLLGQKLPREIKIKQGFAMANLIGQGKDIEFKTTEGLHWYGKAENRPGRKMGHINALGKNPKDALKKVLDKRKRIQL